MPHGPQMALSPDHSISEREFVVLAALLQALQALAIDAMLPAMGEIARDLGARGPNDRQFIIGAARIIMLFNCSSYFFFFSLNFRIIITH